MATLFMAIDENADGAVRCATCDDQRAACDTYVTTEGKFYCGGCAKRIERDERAQEQTPIPVSTSGLTDTEQRAIRDLAACVEELAALLHQALQVMGTNDMRAASQMVRSKARTVSDTFAPTTKGG